MVRAVLALAVATALAPASATATAPTRDLYGWAFPGAPPVGISAASFDGPRVRDVRPGIYRLHLKATDLMPFHLVGPGVDRRTPAAGSRASGPPRGYTVYKTWTIRLRKGRYRYAAEGYNAFEYLAHGFRISGSFVVR